MTVWQLHLVMHIVARWIWTFQVSGMEMCNMSLKWVSNTNRNAGDLCFSVQLQSVKFKFELQLQYLNDMQ